MKNLFFCFLLLSAFIACKDDDCGEMNDGVPTCVKDLYEPGSTQDTNLIAVKRTEVGDEFHYWLNTGNLSFDGPEYIVNEVCDTVCLLCFCPPDPAGCQDDYLSADWEIVWEK